MSNVEKNIKKELSIIPTDENKKGIKIHQRIAAHLETAFLFHKEGVKLHEAGDYEKAAEYNIKAQGHIRSAKHIKEKMKNTLIGISRISF